MGFLDDFFFFNKRERNGIVILLFLILIIVFYRLTISFWHPIELADYNEFDNKVKKTILNKSAVKTSRNSYFYFDPNQVTLDEGLKLGFTNKEMVSWLKYIEKGGVFRVKEDFRKMYFINDSLFKIYEPFIQIERTDPKLKSKQNLEYFYFNPNNLPKEYWLKLGLKSWQISIIKNYEKKLGSLNNVDDVRNIYGIDSLWISKYKNYMVFYGEDSYIVSDKDCNCKDSLELDGVPYFCKLKSNAKVLDKKTFCQSSKWFVYNESELIEYNKVVDFSKELKILEGNQSNELISINEADTNEWKSVYGIGSKLANRIVKYRRSLKGFRSKEQLMEVYGISDTLFQKIENLLIIDDGAIGYIYLNKADYNELASHPYISSKIARVIINFRDAHGGRYEKIEEIKGSVLVSDELYVKIAPYLKID